MTFTYPTEYVMVPVPAALLSQLTGDGSAPAKSGVSVKVTAGDGGDTVEISTGAAASADASGPLTLAKLAATTEAKVWANVDGGYVTICGSAGQVTAAKAALLEFVSAAADRYGEVTIEEWMIPIIVGAKGANIIALQNSTGARLDVDKQKLLITIQGPNKEAIAAAKTSLNETITRLASQRVVLKTNPSGALAVIGRGGATIRRLQVPHVLVLFEYCVFVN